MIYKQKINMSTSFEIQSDVTTNDTLDTLITTLEKITSLLPSTSSPSDEFLHDIFDFIHDLEIQLNELGCPIINIPYDSKDPNEFFKYAKQKQPCMQLASSFGALFLDIYIPNITDTIPVMNLLQSTIFYPFSLEKGNDNDYCGCCFTNDSDQPLETNILYHYHLKKQNKT